MTVAIYSQFGVYPFVVTGANASTGYVLQMIRANGPPPLIPDAPEVPDPTVKYLEYASYAAMITDLGLAASINYAASPYAYVVGGGPNNFATDALAKAAAIADCNKITAKRNANIAMSGIGAGNPYVTIGAPVLGPM